MPVVVPQIDAEIPDGINDLEAYRRWAHSDQFPTEGKFAYLAGKLWMDVMMEQLYTHNRMKTQIAIRLGRIAEDEDLGQYFTDGALLSNPDANFATEPDGIFVSFESLSRSAVRQIPGSGGGCIELIGTPDMVLEVVSKSSVAKDTIELLDLYWQAGIPEYWLIDVRKDALRFDIHRREKTAYATTPADADGWIASTVFQRSFRLMRDVDKAGDPKFTLEARKCETP